MKISLNWLKEFVDFDIEPLKIKDLLTIHTAEIEELHDEAKTFENMVIGQIKSISKHPNADKLSICQVDLGTDGLKQIVCGGNNLREGMLVAVAKPGAYVKWHGEGDLIELKEAKLRGETSYGMICAGEEIGLEPSSEGGITDLSDLNVKIGSPLAEALNKNQIIIEVDNKSLTHRPDLWSHYGFARELSAILGKELKAFEPKVDFPAKGDKVDFQIEAKEMVRGSSFCIVKNVKVQQSPQWMKSKLIACGIRPVNNIVDITNYVMLEIGQPLHGYDRKITGDKLIVRKAKNGEILETIDHKNRDLNSEDIIMANDKDPLLVLGIMGGVNSEISNETCEIIFESGCWDPVLVRKGAQRIGIRTEASQRYEKSLHPKMCAIALKRACEILLQICPSAQIAGPATEITLWDPGEINIEVDTKKLSSKIGVEISEDRMVEILKSLEFETNKNGTHLNVKVPYFRATKDVSIEEDIVEEIARIYGYENIAPILPSLPIKSATENLERVRKHEARKILSLALGFDEAMNYSFYSEIDFKNALLEEKNHIKVENYLSLDQSHMRTSMIPNLLKSAHQNCKSFEKFKIFEIGRIYKEAGNFMPLEEKIISGLIVNSEKNYKDEIFYSAKGAVENFLKLFMVGDFEIKEAQSYPNYAHPKKSAGIYLNDKLIGYLFAINPIVKKNFDIEAEIAAFEINLTEICKSEKALHKYRPLAKFPAIKIDISVVIDKQKTIREIENEIKKANKTLIKETKLFDKYEDSKLGDNKKALAFTITLQAEDKTLTDNEMMEVQNKIFANLEKMGGVIRGKN